MVLRSVKKAIAQADDIPGRGQAPPLLYFLLKSCCLRRAALCRDQTPGSVILSEAKDLTVTLLRLLLHRFC